MRIIVHVDMDAFYAAVEERLNPALRDVPVAVGADPKEGKGRGVVTTANYKARKFGIRSALPISRAWRFAEAARKRGEPATIFIQPNMALYREVSGRIMQILERYADAFEEASIDEAYLDVSSRENFAAATEQMIRLKAEIREREGLGCSVGIGPNKLIAKIASGHQKPDGSNRYSPGECCKLPRSTSYSGHSRDRSQERTFSSRTEPSHRGGPAPSSASDSNGMVRQVGPAVCSKRPRHR